MKLKIKNLIYLLLGSVLIIGCAKINPPLILTAKVSAPLQTRNPAGNEKIQCKRDRFTIDEIKKDIAELESKYELKEKIKGEWKHLKLEKLPVASALFLNKYGSKLGDHNKTDYDFSNCQDIPCLINHIYGKSDGIEGYAAYFYYLKMGHSLGLDNKIYDQVSPLAGTYGDKIYELKDYLFDENELYGFWRLAQTLSDDYRSLSTIKDVERIPRNADIEKRSSMVCGLASSSGNIRLNDGCLRISSDRKFAHTGDFFLSVAHEYSHQIDFTLGRKFKTGYYSEDEEWKKEGQWFIKEELEKETGKVLSRSWDTTLKSEQFVTWYAQTEPAEHFAETLAHFRYAPNSTLKAIPTTTYDLVSNKYFQKNKFDKEKLFEYSIKTLNYFDQTIYQNAYQCSLNLSKPVTECFATVNQKILAEVTPFFKVDTFEYCEQLESNPVLLKEFEANLGNEIKKRMNAHFQEFNKDRTYFTTINELLEKLDLNATQYSIYLNCYELADPERCYQDQLKEKIQKLFEGRPFGEEFVGDFIKRQLEKYSYQKAKEETLNFYQVLAKSEELFIQSSSKNTWDQCLKEKVHETTSLILKPFSPKDKYIAGSLLNCINLDALKIKDTTLLNLVEKYPTMIEKEKSFVSVFIENLIMSSYEEIFLRSIQQEQGEFKTYLFNFQNTSLTKYSDYQWLNGFSLSQDTVLKTCLNMLKKDFSFELYFHDFNEVAITQNSICSTLLIRKEFDDYKKSRKDYFLSIFNDEIKSKLTQTAELKVKDCQELYSLTSLNRFTVKKKQAECFKSKWAYVIPSLKSEMNLKFPSLDPLEMKQAIDQKSFEIFQQFNNQFFK